MFRIIKNLNIFKPIFFYAVTTILLVKEYLIV